MQKVKLPITLDAFRAAQQRLDYKGIYTSEQVSRLRASTVNVNSDVNVELSCEIDSQRFVVLRGTADVDVTLMCQRCSNPFERTVHTTYCFSPVTNEEQANELPEQYEPVEINEFGEIELMSMIEDELILSLPIVPVHESEHCEVSAAEMVFGELPTEAEKPNPFAVLASLKRK